MAEHPRILARKALVSLFSEITGYAAGLFELKGNTVNSFYSDESISRFPLHCSRIQKIKGGKNLCELDECNRARLAFNKTKPHLTLCHAGMYNWAVPVIVSNAVKAVILCGQFQIDRNDFQEKALKNHRQAVSRLKLNNEAAEELYKLQKQANLYNHKQLTELESQHPTIMRWFYAHEEHLMRSVDQSTHEIQTRIQPAVAQAENLYLDSNISDKATKETLDEILFSLLALDTVIKTLGGYLEEYRFRNVRLNTILYESKRIYRAEAKRRGVDIFIKFEEPSTIEGSQNHLQHAFNNLVHNAVKYSFHGTHHRKRYVNITGSKNGIYYRISFENYGVGILKEEIEKHLIFHDGYQGRLTQGEYRTGSGKGLTLVDEVVKRHKGNIEVTSSLKADDPETLEGKPHLNNFTISLPLKQSGGLNG